MKNKLATWALVVAIAAPAGCTAAHSGYTGGGAFATAASSRWSVTFSYFHSDLASYGDWFQDSRYGWCWAPSHVSWDWRPYEDGYWVWTTDGWFWMSYEPWGWATYHYGRWFHDPYYGWLWIPDDVWAPAWVTWHYSDDWIGWAPLPPSARWNYSVGLRWVDVDRIPDDGWCFVPQRHFVGSHVRSVAAPRHQNDDLLRRTRNVTRIDVREGRPVNRGVDVRVVERASGRRVETHRVVSLASPERNRVEVRRGKVEVFRPELRRSARAPTNDERRSVAPAPRSGAHWKEPPARPEPRRERAYQPSRRAAPQEIERSRQVPRGKEVDKVKKKKVKKAKEEKEDRQPRRRW